MKQKMPIVIAKDVNNVHHIYAYLSTEKSLDFFVQPLHLLCLLSSYTNKPLADATACEWGFFFIIGKHLHQTCALKSTNIFLWFLSLLIKHAWCFFPSCSAAEMQEAGVLSPPVRPGEWEWYYAGVQVWHVWRSPGAYWVIRSSHRSSDLSSGG